MKKIISSIFLVFFASNVFSLSKSEKIYNKIKNFYIYKMPDSFSAKVHSKIVDKGLKKIQQKENLNTNPYLQFIFDKRYGGRFIVNDINAIYKNKFASFNNFFQVFYNIVSRRTYKEFSSRYSIKNLKKDSFNIFKIKNKSRYYRVEYLSNGEITKIQEKGLKNQKQASIKIEFSPIQNKKTYPTLLVVYENNNVNYIYFDEVDFNVNLEEENFLG